MKIFIINILKYLTPILNQIIKLLRYDKYLLKFDPKRLTIMILNLEDEQRIKKILSQLFSTNITNNWNAYDTTIAITYLIQRNFQHKDLLNIIKYKDSNLYNYYEYNCKDSFLRYLNNYLYNKIIQIINQDEKIQYLYFMYISEYEKGNYMVSFVFYKNYFDRITACLEHYFAENNKKFKKPNYKGLYKVNALKGLYSNIDGSGDTIEKAHNMRNEDPVSHSSSELLDNKISSSEIK